MVQKCRSVQQCCSEVSFRSVDEQCGSEVLVSGRTHAAEPGPGPPAAALQCWEPLGSAHFAGCVWGSARPALRLHALLDHPLPLSLTFYLAEQPQNVVRAHSEGGRVKVLAAIKPLVGGTAAASGAGVSGYPQSFLREHLLHVGAFPVKVILRRRRAFTAACTHAASETPCFPRNFPRQPLRRQLVCHQLLPFMSNLSRHPPLQGLATHRSRSGSGATSTSSAAACASRARRRSISFCCAPSSGGT